MGLLTALREWIGGLLGSGPEEPDDAADGEAAGSEPEGPDDDRLDPGAVKETRSAATDDAVDKLREVRRTGSSEAADDDEEPIDPSAGDAPTDPGAGDGKR
ncbi:hypothetical protein SAMN04488066_1394 [Halorubrum aquaticum]|uniref:Uncharacterized protein n=1 Tax=Halorubrum aquaticum TaxID=387340 RepID=A0A1I3CZH3_9EURY|nr:hypothetical protein [Halorubrum aquaticum]SFH79904.1 hypothetical protein SAMN04488066_1394 [Halorubrum aquaticum]